MLCLFLGRSILGKLHAKHLEVDSFKSIHLPYIHWEVFLYNQGCVHLSLNITAAGISFGEAGADVF